MKIGIPSKKKSLLLACTLPIIAISVLCLAPESGQAVTFTPQVDIGAGVSTVSSSGNSIGKYIQAIYNYAIGIVGILATVVMMIGGIVWITAAGNQTRISEAKAWIGAALTGLVLALTSYTILAFISPNLVDFRTPTVPKPTQQANTTNPGGTCPGTTINLVNPNDPTARTQCSSQCSPRIVSGQSYYLNEGNNFCCVCEEQCADKPLGTPCYVVLDAGYCYNDVCTTGVGALGQVCGDEAGSRCATGTFWCPSGESVDLGGRDCGPGLRCCNPN